ncbi:MAG TPA: hydroxymethylglutaryl-CoA lyase [Methylocystis sp.]|nr:hydroxymethylglutaryl-CoA lyase [Methylocystis sp.]
MAFRQRVEIVEVGPRDGLQNETTSVSVEDRAQLVKLLAQAGVGRIEVGSFVSEKAVPQMAATTEVFVRLRLPPPIRLSALVPNLAGLNAAIAAGVREVAVFAAASETFSKRNINCSISESLERYAAIAAAAKRSGVLLRGYVSCALGCPYEGAVAPGQVAAVARDLFALGCAEISLGDTIGVGTPLKARRLFELVAGEIGLERVAVHFHDTYGQALANIFACLEVGVGVVDSSIAGLGGCPYAPGASGNVATEDVVYMLQGLDIETGVDLDDLLEAASFISRRLGRAPASAVAKASEGRRRACRPAASF